MIPKGLFIAIIVGISSALALGVYLQKTYNEDDLRFVQGPSISIITDKQDYTLTDTVIIDIVNTGTTNVFLLDDAPTLRVRALDGTEFNSILYDGIKLAPKQKHTIQWNQLKKDDSHVLEGRYVLESYAFTEQNQKIQDSTTVNILK